MSTDNPALWQMYQYTLTYDGADGMQIIGITGGTFVDYVRWNQRIDRAKALCMSDVIGRPLNIVELRRRGSAMPVQRYWKCTRQKWNYTEKKHVPTVDVHRCNLSITDLRVRLAWPGGVV